MPDYIPNLDGKVDPAVAKAIRELYERQYQLRDANARMTVNGKGVSGGDSITAKLMQKITTLPGFSFLQTGDSGFLGRSQGSIVPTILGALLYDNATANVIKWYTTGLELQLTNRARDIFIIPDTTVLNPAYTVTGLGVASYFFYPKYNLSTRMLQFSLVPGGTGTPAIAYAARSDAASIDQSADGFLNLAAGGVAAAATGGGGGGGTGGGSDCPRRGMMVREINRGLIPIELVRKWDIIATNRGIGWTMVTYIAPIICHSFIRIHNASGEIDQSPETPMRMADGTDKLTKDIVSGEYTNTYQGKRKSSVEDINETDDKFLMRCFPHHEFLCGRYYPSQETHNSIAPK